LKTSPVRCHACAGQFTFEHDPALDRFVARHTLPYCAAFTAIDSTLDALRFAERCDLAIHSETKS
jgi:hypothetical protein